MDSNVDVDMTDGLMHIDESLGLPQDLLYIKTDYLDEALIPTAAGSTSALTAGEFTFDKQMLGQPPDMLKLLPQISKESLEAALTQGQQKRCTPPATDPSDMRRNKSSRGDAQPTAMSDSSTPSADVMPSSREESTQSGTSSEAPLTGGVVKAKHVCLECGKIFKRAHNLKIHGRLHSGDKPYGCPFPTCDKEFRWKSSIVSHINWHRTKRGDVLPGEPGDTSIHRFILKAGLAGRVKAEEKAEAKLEEKGVAKMEVNVGRDNSHVAKEDTKIEQKVSGKEGVGATETSSSEAAVADGQTDGQDEVPVESSISQFVEEMTRISFGFGDSQPQESSSADSNMGDITLDDTSTVFTPSTTAGSYNTSPPMVDIRGLESLSVFANVEGADGGAIGEIRETHTEIDGVCLDGLSRVDGCDGAFDSVTASGSGLDATVGSDTNAGSVVGSGTGSGTGSDADRGAGVAAGSGSGPGSEAGSGVGSGSGGSGGGAGSAGSSGSGSGSGSAAGWGLGLGMVLLPSLSSCKIDGTGDAFAAFLEDAEL